MDAVLCERARQMAEEMAGDVQTPADLNAMMRVMAKTLMERVLDAEMDVHLGRTQVNGSAEIDVEQPAASQGPSLPDLPAAENDKRKRRNRRNGRSSKTVQGDLGEVTISTPRDRDGSFEPQLVPKYQRRLAGFDEKVLALYAKGMSTRDIQDLLKQLYDVEVSCL